MQLSTWDGCVVEGSMMICAFSCTGAAGVENMVGWINTSLQNIGQVHVGFPKVGRVRTRATRAVAAPMFSWVFRVWLMWGGVADWNGLGILSARVKMLVSASRNMEVVGIKCRCRGRKTQGRICERWHEIAWSAAWMGNIQGCVVRLDMRQIKRNGDDDDEK